MSAALNDPRPSLVPPLDEQVEEAPAELYTGVLVGLKSMREALSRRRWLWLAFAALGLIIGTDFHLLVPTKVTAVTSLYMTEPSSAGENGMTDDISLLYTDKVIDKAYSYMDLKPGDPQPGSFTAISQSPIILTISASAPTPAEAVSWDNALAKAFFAVRDQELGSQTALLVNVLKQQVSQLDAQVTQLNKTIQALTNGPGGTNAANELSELISERGGDTSQVSALQNEIQQEQTNQALVVQGSKVIDPAVASSVSKKKVLVMDGASGLIAGLALGIGIVVIAALVSDRPRRRSQIAGLLEAPVELSVTRMPLPSLKRSGLRRAVNKSPVELEMVQRRLAGQLAASGGGSLAVVSVAADQASAFALAGLALKLSSEGRDVTLVDMTEQRSLAHLLDLSKRGGPPTVMSMENHMVRVVIAGSDPSGLRVPELGPNDVVLLQCTLDPSLGADHLPAWVDASVVLMTVGKVSETKLYSIGQLLRQVGLGPRSVILFGGDREDETAGLVDPGPRPGATPNAEPAAADGTAPWTARVPGPAPAQYARHPQ